MARDHVSALFSAAYDDALDADEAARFRSHIDECEQCGIEYDAFRNAVNAVRALPPARMPRPVHVPSTPPVAETHSFGTRLRGVQLRRFLPGGATALAGVAAVVILILVTRQTAPGTPRTQSGAALAPRFSAAPGAGCPTTLSGTVLANTPPSDYQHRATAIDPGRPGQQLILASANATVAPGSQVVVFAQLTIPRPSDAAPGSHGAPQQLRALPCLSVNGPSASKVITQRLTPLQAQSQAPDEAQPVPGSGIPVATPLEAFTVPPDTPTGTQLHVTATIPPGFPDPGDPPLIADLVIAVQ